MGFPFANNFVENEAPRNVLVVEFAGFKYCEGCSLFRRFEQGMSESGRTRVMPGNRVASADEGARWRSGEITYK